jgi:hypothetical protein
MPKYSVEGPQRNAELMQVFTKDRAGGVVGGGFGQEMHGAKYVVAANVQDMEVRMVVIRGVGFRDGRGFDLVFFANAHGEVMLVLSVNG